MKCCRILKKEGNMTNLVPILKNMNNKVDILLEIFLGRKESRNSHNFTSDFFGGGGHRQERKGPELGIKIPVTLEHIYNGKEIGV